MTAMRASSGKFMEFADDESRLRLQVLGRTYPQKSDYWDGNWLSTKIEVKSGAFVGAYTATLRSDEVETFRSQLQELAEGERDGAQFEATEDWLQIDAARDSEGAILRCLCKSRSGAEGGLTFNVTLSSEAVTALLEQLEAIMQEFPVVGESGAH